MSPADYQTRGGYLSRHNYLLRREEWARTELSAPGPIRPSPAMYRRSDEWVGDCEYVDQDESIVHDAVQRLTYVHRVDHTPEDVYPAETLLLFRVERTPPTRQAIDWALGQILQLTRETRDDNIVSHETNAPAGVPKILPPLEDAWSDPDRWE